MKLMKVTIPARLGGRELAAFAAVAFVFMAAGVQVVETGDVALVGTNGLEALWRQDEDLRCRRRHAVARLRRHVPGAILPSRGTVLHGNHRRDARVWLHQGRGPHRGSPEGHDPRFQVDRQERALERPRPRAAGRLHPPGRVRTVNGMRQTEASSMLLNLLEKCRFSGIEDFILTKSRISDNI